MWQPRGLVGSPSSLPQHTSKRAQNPSGLLQRFVRSPTFILGTCSGIALSWLLNEFALVMIRGERPSGRCASAVGPWPMDSPTAGSYHAIIVPAGGQTADGPPPHVLSRLERAVHLYEMSPEPKPYIITTAWGTPHKPCPHDAAGFERHEAEDNARYLIRHGVPPASILEESVSLETVGNAYYSRVLHTDVRALTKLVIINNHFHMPRTKAVFGHVFRVPPLDGHPDASYELDYVEVEDRLEPEILEVRLRKEAASLPKFEAGGAWQDATPTLRELHDWVHMENTAYASKRLVQERKPLDPELLKSY